MSCDIAKSAIPALLALLAFAPVHAQDTGNTPRPSSISGLSWFLPHDQSQAVVKPELFQHGNSAPVYVVDLYGDGLIRLEVDRTLLLESGVNEQTGMTLPISSIDHVVSGISLGKLEVATMVRVQAGTIVLDAEAPAEIANAEASITPAVDNPVDEPPHPLDVWQRRSTKKLKGPALLDRLKTMEKAVGSAKPSGNRPASQAGGKTGGIPAALPPLPPIPPISFTASPPAAKPPINSISFSK